MTQVESFDKKRDSSRVTKNRDSSHDITADKANEINVFMDLIQQGLCQTNA